MKKISDHDFKNWSKGFTIKVLTLLSVFWFIFMCYSGFLMIYAIYKTGEFSFLDTYINRICDCFMAGVITGLITRTIGNVFEFNDGSFMGVSNGGNVPMPPESETLDTPEEFVEDNQNEGTFSEEDPDPVREDIMDEAAAAEIENILSKLKVTENNLNDAAARVEQKKKGWFK